MASTQTTMPTAATRKLICSCGRLSVVPASCQGLIDRVLVAASVVTVIAIVAPMVVRNRDPDDLAKPDRRWAEPDVRHVEIAIRTERHRRRQRQPRGDLHHGTVP